MLKKTEVLDIYEKRFGKKLAGPNKETLLKNLSGNPLIDANIFFNYFSSKKSSPSHMVSRKGLNEYAKYINTVINKSDMDGATFNVHISRSVKFIVCFMRKHSLKSFDEYMAFRPPYGHNKGPYCFLHHYKCYSILRHFIVCYPGIRDLLLDCDKEWLYSDFATLLKNFKKDKTSFYAGSEYEKIQQAISTINKFV